MRRKDREVKGFEDIIKIMEKCDVCRIALNNDGYPYILPLNFGLKVEGEKVESAPHPQQILYVELSGEADRYDLLRMKKE